MRAKRSEVRAAGGQVGFQDAFWMPEETDLFIGALKHAKGAEIQRSKFLERKMIEWKEGEELGYLNLLDKKVGKSDR